MNLRELQNKIDALSFDAPNEQKDEVITELRKLLETGDWFASLRRNIGVPNAEPSVFFLNEKAQQFIEAPMGLQ